MPTITAPGCELDWTLLDLSPPWAPATETIVFHHGLGANQNIWAEWLPLLAGTCRILCFDMRGHGRSRAEPGAALSMDALTDDLFAVMDAAGVHAAHLVGESIGGTIVLNACLRQPNRVATLTVCNGAHQGGSIQAVHDWKRIIDNAGMEGWSRHMMQCRFFEGGIPAALRDWYQREQARTDPDVLLRGVAALVGADLAGRLAEVGAPVLLIHPDASPFIPVEVMVAFQRGLPDGRLNVIGHARHGMPVSHAKTCAALLRDFLAETGRHGVAPNLV